MEDLIIKLKALESENLSQEGFIDAYVKTVNSYLDLFNQEERYQHYQKLMKELKNAPLSESAKLAIAYIN